MYAEEERKIQCWLAKKKQAINNKKYLSSSEKFSFSFFIYNFFQDFSFNERAKKKKHWKSKMKTNVCRKWKKNSRF